MEESGGDLDAIDRLLLECMEGPESTWSDAVAAACERHPEHAPVLRRRFAVLGHILRTVPGSGP